MTQVTMKTDGAEHHVTADSFAAKTPSRGPAIASGQVHQSGLSRAHDCHGGTVLAPCCARARTDRRDRRSTVIIGGVEINRGNRVGW